MVTPIFHGLLLLAVLGIAVFAANAVRGWLASAVLAAGFVSTALWITPQRMPDPVWVGGLVAALSALQLFRPRYNLASAFFGGALAGMCGPLVEALGINALFGWAFGAGEAALVAYLVARHAEFAPAQIREEALLSILAFGVILAAVPGILSGWQSALALNIEANDSVNSTVPIWALSLGVFSAISGCLYTIWRHR